MSTLIDIGKLFMNLVLCILLEFNAYAYCELDQCDFLDYLIALATYLV